MCSKMDGTGGYSGKGNKLNTDRQELHVLSYEEFKKKKVDLKAK
jgi:hypothetical protein